MYGGNTIVHTCDVRAVRRLVSMCQRLLRGAAGPASRLVESII